MHCVRRAASRAACTAGSSNATRMPIMAMTTSSSTSVNPLGYRLSHPPHDTNVFRLCTSQSGNHATLHSLKVPASVIPVLNFLVTQPLPTNRYLFYFFNTEVVFKNRLKDQARPLRIVLKHCLESRQQTTKLERRFAVCCRSPVPRFASRTTAAPQ